MSDFEESLFVDRTNKVMEQWPMVNEAHGCVNCHLLFKSPKKNQTCPGCGSESIFDVAAILNRTDGENHQDRATPA